MEVLTLLLEILLAPVGVKLLDRLHLRTKSIGAAFTTELLHEAAVAPLMVPLGLRLLQRLEPSGLKSDRNADVLLLVDGRVLRPGDLDIAHVEG